MTKTYVLDTNVLLSDPNSIFNFGEHDVVIPLVTLEELDGKKQEQSEIGRNARAFGRIIDQLREQGDLRVCVRLGEKKGCLMVDTADEDSVEKIPTDLDHKKADVKILAVALKNNAILVTKDILLRVIADSIGVISEDYRHDKLTLNDEFTGTTTYDVEGATVHEFYREGSILIEDDFYPNEYVLLRDEHNHKSSAMTRYDAQEKALVALNQQKELWGIKPKNLEQNYAFDCLLNPEIRLVTLSGPAGTGKSLVSVAAALYQTLDLGLYKKIFISRPIMSIGESLGYLPGNLQEKLAPWVAPIVDAISFIMESPEGSPSTKKGKKKLPKQQQEDLDEKAVGSVKPIAELMLHNIIEFAAIEHLRGRSLPNQFILIDECQNASKAMVKTILSRAGEGTKIVLIGDTQQIDAPYLDASNNGLAYAIDKFKEQKIAAHITLDRGERSELATLASELL